jgi:hypothetical protein
MEDVPLFIWGCVRSQVTEHIRDVLASLFIEKGHVQYGVDKEDSPLV